MSYQQNCIDVWRDAYCAELNFSHPEYDQSNNDRCAATADKAVEQFEKRWKRCDFCLGSGSYIDEYNVDHGTCQNCGGSGCVEVHP